ncbi:MAG TPA: M23 family metallopeptidase [Devosia sp.]|nr:M23 family metallopeptidase [Devosia sp.]
MAPEISTIFGNQDRYAYQAYQERILQLRMEVDRLHSRQYLQTGNLNLKLQELMQQQRVLSEQFQYIRILSDKADELGLTTASLGEQADEAEFVTTGAVAATLGDAQTVNLEIVSQSVAQMMDESTSALSAISSAAKESTNAILSELRSVGIPVQIPGAADLAMGGPLLPASAGQQAPSLAQNANEALLALERFEFARSALSRAPILHPLETARRVSSYFGNRRDPFGGGGAFHSGMDYPAPRGALVSAAGAGKIVWSGRRNGYGIMVEVEHANGLFTRYAHMSATLVEKGQMVAAGAPIGKVGSTGRSTGPHLHFEVRDGADPVNPADFLRVAERLQDYLI